MVSRDANNPQDNDVISSYPANERAQRSAQSVIFNGDHFDPDDADQGKHRQCRLVDLSGDPGGGGTEGVLYSKTINGIVECFYIDSNGLVSQLTNDGKLNNPVVNMPQQAVDPTVPVDAINLYTKQFNGQAEIFWQDEAGNVARLTFNGELAIDLQFTDIVVGSLRTNNFYRGRRRTISSVAGAIEIDFETATVFEITITEDTVFTFVNMPDTADGEEQTIYLDLIDGGNFALSLTSSYTLIVPDGVSIPLTVDGRDLIILSTNDGLTIFLGIIANFTT